MSIVNRDSEFYKSLDGYKATAYAEGFCEGENATEFEQVCAWQYLVDTGKCWRLQGFFGRTAKALIDQGIIERVHQVNDHGKLIITKEIKIDKK